MEQPIVIKYAKLGYIVEIISAFILYIAILSLCVFIIAIPSIYPTPEGEYAYVIFMRVFSIMLIAVCTIICAVYIIHCILSIKKKRLEFYDDHVEIMYGDRKLYMFFYSDIAYYYVIRWLSSCYIATTKFQHFRRGEIDGRLFSLCLSKHDLLQVANIINSKTQI